MAGINEIGMKNRSAGAPLGAFLTPEQMEALGIAKRSSEAIRRELKEQVRLQDELDDIEGEIRGEF